MLSGLPFGMLISVIDMLIDGYHPANFYFHLFVYAFLLSLFLVEKVKYKLKDVGVDKVTEDELVEERTKIVYSEIDPKSLLKRLKNDAYFGQLTLSESAYEIKMVRQVSLKSTGEIITLNSELMDNKQHQYEITCKGPTALIPIDYAQHKQNLERVESIMKAESN